MTINFRVAWAAAGSVLIFAGLATAQRPKPAMTAAKPMIFAIVGDGKLIEPIGYIQKGTLAEPVNGSGDPKAISAFNKSYYKTGASYDVIFGGAKAGTAVITSGPGAECSKNVGSVQTKSLAKPLKGLI